VSLGKDDDEDVTFFGGRAYFAGSVDADAALVLFASPLLTTGGSTFLKSINGDGFEEAVADKEDNAVFDSTIAETAAVTAALASGVAACDITDTTFSAAFSATSLTD
jgi:hypothetical protein